MIVAKLQGGLGNQMFQYAAAKCLAVRHNTEVFFDTRWFDNIPSTDTKRWYELDCFNIQRNDLDMSKFQVISRGLGRKSKLKLAVKGITKKRLWAFEIPGHEFNAEFDKLPDNTYLDGWFTSEEYFKNIRDVLQKDFSYKNAPAEVSKKLLAIINEVHSVSLHVRRGDYVSNKHANKWHGLTGLDYYKESVAVIAKTVKTPEFFVFSDDPEWCKINLKINFPTTFVSHNTSGAEDMRLMRACQHNIITNSTFSWWGAWLNENPRKIVIAPKQWLADSKIETSDIIPKQWQKI